MPRRVKVCLPSLRVIMFLHEHCVQNLGAAGHFLTGTLNNHPNTHQAKFIQTNTSLLLFLSLSFSLSLSLFLAHEEAQNNKAVYTGALVACGWAGAVMWRAIEIFGQGQ